MDRDAGRRVIHPDAAPPDGALALACHPDTVFLVIDAPGREVDGANLLRCDAGVAGQPVTVLNHVGKDLQIAVAAIEVDCTSSGCVSIYRDVEPCDASTEQRGTDPCRGPSNPWSPTKSSGSRQSSLMLGGEGVRFRVTACTTG